MRKIGKKQAHFAVLVALAALTLIVVAPGAAPAELANVSGSLSSPGGIVVNGKWASATLSWDITYNEATNVWHYVYTWSPTGTGNLSHFMLEVTEGSKADEFFNFVNASISSGDPQLYTKYSPPNPNMPFDLFGMKLQSASGGGWTIGTVPGNPIGQIFSFDSYHSPTMGNFYAQDGKGTYAYNNVENTVAVPNGIVPIPPAAWLLSSGLLGLAVIRRRLKK